MAKIVINEISQNYTYNIGNTSYCEVAMPITSSWGPGYFNPDMYPNMSEEDIMESVAFQRFPATQAGLEAFVSTYRGPASNHRLAKDYSYQAAMTLLSAGYDILACRVAPGAVAKTAGAVARRCINQFTVTIPEDSTAWDLSSAFYFRIEGVSGASTEIFVPLENTSVLDQEPEIISGVQDGIAYSYNKWHLTSGSAFTITFTQVDTKPIGHCVDATASNFDSDAHQVKVPDAVLTVIGYSAAMYYDESLDPSDHTISISAKYPGTFGNNLMIKLTPITRDGINKYWNLIVYVLDSFGTRTAAENLSFVFNEDNATETIPYVDEVESEFIKISAIGLDDDGTEDANYVLGFGLSEEVPYSDTAELALLEGGTDAYKSDTIDKAIEAEPAAEVFGRFGCCDVIYVPVPQADEAPQFVPNKYYIKHDPDPEVPGSTYSFELTSHQEPPDWSTTYFNYFTKEDVESDSELAGHTVTELYIQDAVDKATYRYMSAYPNESLVDIQNTQYVSALQDLIVISDSPVGVPEWKIANGGKYYHYSNNGYYYDAIATVDLTDAKIFAHREWIFNAAYKVYDLLTDKLAYNPKRVISPGWDDQDILYITGELALDGLARLSPFHIKLMNIAYYSRCATAYLDIPRSLPRAQIYDENSRTGKYAQLLGRYEPMNVGFDVNGQLYHTHASLFVPWGQYKYVGTSKYNIASPSFQALMIERSMILNQSAQYEWALPVNRHHKVKLGKLDFAVSKKYLDVWQKLEGVGVNVITNIPDMGISLWGNSTLYEVPPATYQALANLSTRKLVNAVEDIVYRCGIAITFQYNNDQAYSSFYAGVTPLLDTMKNIGAIDDYYVKMAADINGEDHVNANTVIGKIYLVINGVINDIIVDLVALPPSTDLSQFKG